MNYSLGLSGGSGSEGYQAGIISCCGKIFELSGFLLPKFFQFTTVEAYQSLKTGILPYTLEFF
jgi:hypothetical protein